MDMKKLQEFMELLGRLKHMKRKGWVLKEVDDPETIAGHMYRMAMLSFLVGNEENLDKVKIMQMALIHDLAECIVGDITPHCGIPPDEKHRMEDAAMENICKLLGDRGPMILEMFRVRKIAAFYIRCYEDSKSKLNTFKEYEKQESPEAKYVKDLDRLDLIMQAYEYEKRDNDPGKLEEFFVATDEKIAHPFIKKLASEINTTRKALICSSNSSK